MDRVIGLGRTLKAASIPRWPKSLSEIEKATLRVVAFNKTGSVHRAAGLLGIASVSLARWLDRRVRLAGRMPQVGHP